MELLDDPITGTVVRLQGTAQVTTVNTEVTVSGSWSRLGSADLSNLSTSSNTSQTSPYPTTLTFNPLRISNKDGGDYMYTVFITPQDSTYIISTSMNMSYTLTIQPYPVLEISDSITSGVCMTNEVAVLMGGVSLLPNTATNTLIYTWVDPSNQTIRTSTSDLVVSSGDLTVMNIMNNMGVYSLTVCLEIPGSCMGEYCSTASYTLNTDGKRYIQCACNINYDAMCP